jgi:hypothetical protein
MGSRYQSHTQRLGLSGAGRGQGAQQAQSAIAHALRVIEADYLRKRTHIINSADEQPTQTEPRT